MKFKREYSIALLVILGIAVLIFGVNFLKGLDLFQKRNVYHAVYNNISGISSASPVYYNGYKVGLVINTGMVPDGSGKIAISIQLNEDELKIPRDSRLRIYSADLFSRALQLIVGKSGELAQQGDTLLGDIELSFTDALGENIDPLKVKAEGMFASVDSVLTSFQQILNPQTVGDIDSSFTSIRSALQSLSQAAAKIDRLVAEESASLAVTMQNLERVTGTLANNGDAMDRIFSNLDSLSAELAHGQLKVVLTELASVSKELHQVTQDINSGQGSMGKLLKEDSLYNNLNSASVELDLLLEDFRINPNRYVHLSLFGKKDRLPKLSDSDIDRINRSMQEKTKP